jgi:hypothetical protein
VTVNKARMTRKNGKVIEMNVHMTLTIGNITRYNSTFITELKLPNIPQQHTILDSVRIEM